MNRSSQFRKQLNPNNKHFVFILLASSYFIDPRVKQEVSTLIKNNFFVYILTWDREGIYSDFYDENLYVKNVRLLTSITFTKMLYVFSAIIFQFSVIFYGIKVLTKNHITIIHANDANTLPGAVLLKKLFRKKVKIIYDSHELTPAVYSEWYGYYIGSIMGKIERILLKSVNKIITVSPPIVKHLESISSHKVNLIWNYPSKEIIPNYNKTEMRESLGIEKEDFVIVYVGTLRLDIALSELIDAIAHIKNNYPSEYISKIKVFIIGDGSLYTHLHEKIQTQQCYDYVKLVGRVNRDISLSYLKAADLSYILFTVKGLNTQIGMPWKLFESLVSGIQAIVINKTYASTFIKKYNAGYTIDKINAEEIAKAIIKAYNDVDNKKANTNLSDIFVWENQENNFIELYKSLLAI